MPSQPPRHRSPRRIRAGSITVCAMVATLMQSLDSTIANVALPYMQGSLSASYDQITWVLTSYIIAAAIMTAPVGWLVGAVRPEEPVSGLAGRLHRRLDAVRHRRHRCARWCCSGCCKGVFGAALVPLSQATMLNIYPPEQRGSAMAIWGMGVMVGPILGPRSAAT